MRISLFILFIISLSVFCSCTSNSQSQLAEVVNSDYQYNWKTKNVNSKVKYITCVSYQQFIPNDQLDSYITKEDYVFDVKGNIIEEIIYLEDQRFHYKRKYDFDKMNNYIKYDKFSEGGEVDYSAYNFFDKKGRLVQYREKKMGEVTYQNDIQYNDVDINRILITENQTVPRATDIFHREELYNNGVLKELIRYMNDQSSKSQEKFTYDKSKNKISEIRYSSLDTTYYESKTVYSYDNQNRVTIQNNFKNESSIFLRKTTYDESGNIASETVISDGVLDNKKSFVNKFEYDNNQNWLKKSTFFIDGRQKSITIRKIGYF